MNQRKVTSGIFLTGLALSVIVGAYPAGDASAAITCERDVRADVVVIDQPLMFNRLGAGNPNAMIYALERDVIFSDSKLPLTVDGRTPNPGNPGELYELRPDKRPRPMVLRVRAGDCLTVNLQNLLKPAPNPLNAAPLPGPLATAAGQLFTIPLDEQPVSRWVGFHAAGMQMVTGIYDDGSIVGSNPVLEDPPNQEGGLVSPGHSTRYKLYAEKEGVFLVTSEGVLIGSDGNEGHVTNGLFGQVIVEPKESAIYRGQVFEEELRLAIDVTKGCVLGTETGCNGPANPGHTPDGHPILDYEAVYPGAPGDGSVWAMEGKAGLPVLNMIRYTGANGDDGPIVHIVHSEINAVIAHGPTGATTVSGVFPGTTYPLESRGLRNPTVPNRLEPFREFSSMFHDETANAQAFPGFYVADPVFKYVLAGVKDAFMINYGSGGIGSEIIANRLGVGPMHDCLDCSYEEFFLTSFTVADPAMLVDVPANVGLEACGPAGLGGAACAAAGPKANYAIGGEDPSNIHHSYIGDFAKFRNTHAGKEQHVFHLHNHQWLFNPNDDNSNYMDAQGIGPGAGYTYEINFGGSGNRNKSAGDSIFHCHFYPHFAQGMWYHWRHNDTFQAGTILAATPHIHDQDGYAIATGFHGTPWALADTTPAAGARAYPDGEISTGTPIPAVVPLPGKPMAVMPGRATVVAKVVNGITVGSNAHVIDRDVNPGFPFWVAGIEDIVGQRPTTPPLDMANPADVDRAKTANPDLFAHLDAAQADGWDGGLPRHALEGYASGGNTAANHVSATDFSKRIGTAKAVFYPEEGTDLEQVAMAFHQLTKYHPTYLPNGTPANGTDPTIPGAILGFRTNGSGGPVVGAPFHNPCIDDRGNILDTGVVGTFFGGKSPTDMSTRGSSVFTSDNPRIYKGTFLQFDAVLNKVGYHYPQERIVSLWQDAGPIIAKQKAPEPMVFRFNTFDCMVYHNSNLVPENYEMDDYQVRTPTDIIGQHIHLPKWDLTTTDGAANGWNYEDGTLSPGAVQERIEAINHYGTGHVAGTGAVGLQVPATLEAKPHPYFARVATALGGGFPARWLGARTTIERWFADPVVNVAGVDRGLGIIFTHDHYGPSSHQQIGLYATALTEPAGSLWKHNETGTQLACTAPGARPTAIPAGTTVVNNTPCRWDGGPTSWQAQILPPVSPPGGSTVLSETVQPFREFYFEFSDFQHAYEAGVYVGAGQNGLPLPGTGPGAGPKVANTGNLQFDNSPANAFRFAINPPARAQINPVFPELVLETAGGVLPGCPTRPCPQAISVEDPGMLVINYRSEPVGLRIFDPNKPGPDGKPGMQADGERGDLAFALQTRIDRVIPQLNVQPTAATVINGTKFPPPINIVSGSAVGAGDPFTPMMRTYAGDVVRVKLQAGGHEEEHNATIFGMKWLQAGSGHGRAPNSGWRNAQAAGISEQFTLAIPVVPTKTTGSLDYGYTMDASHDGWWSGMWGILRAYNTAVPTLPVLPSSAVPIKIANPKEFISGTTCPVNAPDGRPTPRRNYDITAVLANNALGNNLGAFLPTPLNTVAGTPAGDAARQHVGGPLNAAGGTLVYNNRNTTVGGQTVCAENLCITLPTHQGPLHDPTAILYVRTADLDAAGKLKAGVPVEPLVLRAAAGECISVTLRNRLPALAQVNIGTPASPVLVNNSTAPDLATYSTIQGVVKRDRFSPFGATTFNSNLYRPSSWVGITPQLLAFDVEKDGGVVVGLNSPGQAVVKPGANKTFNWYAGDLSAMQVAGKQFQLFATPVELGGASLLPADKIKQGAKSLVGALVIEPRGASWPGSAANLNKTDAGDLAALIDTHKDHQAVSPAAFTKTRAQTTVTSGGTAYRDFSLVLTKGMTQYYKDGTPVEHMNGEAIGLPEDSQEASGMSLNYGIEPLWFRFGLVPQAPFGNAGAGPGTYGGVPNSHRAYSNALPDNLVNGNPVGDPVTPVFLAKANQEARIRITNPFGTSRGSTFALHGHVWQRDPYVCNDDNQYGLPGKCNAPATGSFIDPVANRPLVGARSIGANPLGISHGGQESWNAPSHFDIRLPSAGGGNGEAGDYLFRDKASFGNASGIWGILRVQP